MRTMLWMSFSSMIVLWYETILQEEAPPCVVNTNPVYVIILYNENVATRTHTDSHTNVSVLRRAGEATQMLNMIHPCRV